MRTAFILPHTDDEALSCGGLIQRLAEAEEEMTFLFVYGRKTTLGPLQAKEAWDCTKASLNLLGVDPAGAELCMLPEGEPGETGYYTALENVEDTLDVFKPSRVVIPGPSDLNQDHRFLNEVCKIALRPHVLNDVQQVLEFVGLDIMDAPKVNYGLEVHEGHLKLQEAAMACYPTEVRYAPHPRSAKMLRAQRQYYGSRYAVDFAEPYNVILNRHLLGGTNL
jgi:LmbE family N-acetylglucosaminyl deacetylase